MGRWVPGVVVGAVLIALGRGVTAQPQAGPSDALVVTYADGRVTESLVPEGGYRAWTPYFPRINGWREPAGVPPVRALNLRASREGARVRVVVSVLRGPGHAVEDAVATVEVDASSPVVVDHLRRVGLQPVTLSMKPFAVPALHVPSGASRVDGLTIEGIEPVTTPDPAYLITVRNTTDVPALTVAFNTYASNRPALSGQQGDPTAIPIIEPGGTFTFRLGLRGGRDVGAGYATATPLDEVIVTGVIWADGRRAGDEARVMPMLALHRGRLAALTPVIAILRDSRGGAEPLTAMRAVRNAIAGLPVAADAMAVATVMRLVPGLNPHTAEGVAPAIAVGSQNVRRRLIDDLDRVLPTFTAAQARQWLDEALPACEAWHARLLRLFTPPSG
jgi:hypothetical protein